MCRIYLSCHKSYHSGRFKTVFFAFYCNILLKLKNREDGCSGGGKEEENWPGLATNELEQINGIYSFICRHSAWGITVEETGENKETLEIRCNIPVRDFGDTYLQMFRAFFFPE